MSNYTTKTVINFFFDDSVADNTGWAYDTVVTTYGIDGICDDKEHDSGPIAVKRRDAGLTTLRRAFFRDTQPGSFFAGLRSEAARAQWEYVQGGYRLVIKR